MQILTSIENPKVKFVQQLHHKKYRNENNKFIAEGLNVCKTLLKGKVKLYSFFITENHLEMIKNIIPENKINIINQKILKKISLATTPSGIIGIFEIPQPKDELSAGVALTQIQDPGNMGTLIRTAAAMKLKTFITIECTDPWSPKVVQSTAGTIGMLNIFELSWKQLIKKKEKLKLCALVVKDGKDEKKLKFKDTILIIGNEANGIPKEWIKECEEKLTLKMPGKTESLNAAVAGSIAMYLAFSK
jgi:RNA methyltransferase, TrmH family